MMPFDQHLMQENEKKRQAEGCSTPPPAALDGYGTLPAANAHNHGWQQDAKYFYYPHGPLARTELGHNKVQGIDHAYTAHGWLKALNSNTLGPDNDMGEDAAPNGAGATIHNNIATDAFGLSLHYYTDASGTDYTPRAGSATPAFLPLDGTAWGGAPSLYNGNIARMATTVATTAQGSAFTYDQLNRLTTAEHFYDLSTNTLGETANPTPEESDHYSSYIYDSNGNIMALNRIGDAAPMDELTYTYATTDNRLQRVVDALGVTAIATDIESMSTDFTYDRNGNLISDPTANIANMLWHPNGKLNAIIRDGANDSPTLIFSYDGLGNRVRKVQVARDIRPARSGTGGGNTLPMAQWDITYYIRDAQGNHLTTIDRKFIETDTYEATDRLSITETVMYGSDRLGTRTTHPDENLLAQQAFTHSGANEFGEYQDLTPDGDLELNDAPTDLHNSYEGAKHYELKNHLGNVLATVSDKRDVEVDGSYNVLSYTPVIDNVSFYYPFGSLMPEISDFGGGHRFGFNGMQKDNEVRNVNGASLDFGARMYNSQLGRWMSIDPKYRVFPNVSPYVFAACSPLFYIDNDGNIIIPANEASKNKFSAHIEKVFGPPNDGSFSKFLLEAISSERRPTYAEFAATITTLDPSQKAAARMYFAVQNRQEKIVVAYIKKDEKLSEFLSTNEAREAVGSNTFREMFPESINAGNATPDGSGFTVFIDEERANDPSNKVNIDEEMEFGKGSGEINADLVTGHEMGEAFTTYDNSSTHGKGSFRQTNTIQIDNIFRRILGLKGARNGSDHGNGQVVPSGKRSEVPKSLGQ